MLFLIDGQLLLSNCIILSTLSSYHTVLFVHNVVKIGLTLLQIHKHDLPLKKKCRFMLTNNI